MCAFFNYVKELIDSMGFEDCSLECFTDQGADKICDICLLLP